MSFVDHFTSLDSAVWGSLTAGSGTVSATDSTVEMVRTASASDAAAVYLKTQVDTSKAQIYVWALSHVSGATGAFAWLINDASTPTPSAPGTWGPKTRMSAGLSTLTSVTGLFLQYFTTGHSAQQWNGSSNAWSTNVHAVSPYINDNYVEMFLETDPTLGARWGILTNMASGTSYTFDQGRHLVALTDWVAWASMESTSSLWLVLGYPQVVSQTVTARVEWFRYADGTRVWSWSNRKDAASGNYPIRSEWHYGDYYFVPRDRSTDDIAADARVPMVSIDADGTRMMVYTSVTGTAGLKLATSPDDDGPWTLQGTILTHPATTNRYTIGHAAIYRDLTETDPAKIYKIWVSCVNNGPPYTWRVFLAYAATRTGTYTWYDDGSGADNSVILGPGTSGSYDEGGCVIEVIHWDTTTGQWMARYGANSDTGALLQGKPAVAYSPTLTNGGTWTKYGSNPVLVRNDVYQDITANLNGKTVTVADTTGFVADAMIIIGQSTSSADDWSMARIRKVLSSTQLELYSQLVGFTTTTPARVRQLDSFPKNAMTALRYDTDRGEWVAVVTSFQPFNLDSPLLGFCEGTTLWTAPDHLGPWTMDALGSGPVPLNYFGGKRSVENFTFAEPALEAPAGLLLLRMMSEGLFVGSEYSA